MQHSLPKTLPDFHQASVLVIGDVMLDRYWFGETSRISPEAPVPIVKIENAENRPGGASNVALNIAALGAKVILLGVIGKDEAADILDEKLKASSVNHDLCKIDALSTIVKLRVISRHQQLLRMDFEDSSLSAYQNDLIKHELIKRFKKHLPHVNMVILSDYKKGTLADPALLIQLAREANVPVLVDPKGSDFSIYQQSNVITPNFKEFETIVGTCRNEKDIIDKGRDLLYRNQIDTLIVTRGEEGMTLINQSYAAHLEAYAREVLDVTGAGDTVISLLGTALAANVSIKEAAALANLGASLVVAKLGAAAVSRPELESALSGKAIFTRGIADEDELLQVIKQVRLQNKKIVFTNGCFDLLHAGHVVYLELAKQLGDYLIVAVNTDASIQKFKGQNRPINHLDHRMKVLSSLKAVDWVVPFADDTPERLLKNIKPDFLVKGGDYRLDQVVGADIVRAYGGQVRVIHSAMETSSTGIIDRITSHRELKNTLEGEIQSHG